MIRPLILATAFALVPLGDVSAGPFYDPNNAFGYYDSTAKYRKESAELKRFLEQEKAKAYLQGFQNKQERKAFDKRFEKVSEKLYHELLKRHGN